MSIVGYMLDTHERGRPDLIYIFFMTTDGVPDLLFNREAQQEDRMPELPRIRLRALYQKISDLECI